MRTAMPPVLNLKQIRTEGNRAGLPGRGASGDTLANPTVPIDGAVQLLHVLAGLIGRRVTNASASHIAVIAIKPSVGAAAHAIEQVAKHFHDRSPSLLPISNHDVVYHIIEINA